MSRTPAARPSPVMLNGQPEGIDAERLRRQIVEQSRRAGVGHIGSALSIVDIVAVLLDGRVRGLGSGRPDRDLLILSKGHAALALYCAMTQLGVLSQAELDTYCQDGSLLGVHPEHQLRGIDFSTGSLGNGLSFGAGAALADRIAGRDSHTYVLMSDAELNEGLVWEAAMFAAHHGLSNLTAIVDANGQQALGKTADVLDLDPIHDRFAAFGWDAISVDGHDRKALEAALAIGAGRPTVVVARTVAGKGVSFMEGRIEWHYLPVSDDQYRQAIRELGG